MIPIPKPKKPDEDDVEKTPETEDEDIYEEKEREELMEDDEVEPWEEGFVEGETDEGQKAKCRRCGKLLTVDNTYEREIDGEVEWFCSEKHADEYEKKRAEEE